MTTTSTPQPEQLALIAEPAVPVQFRLDERTRRRGLSHIAEIRRQFAATAEHAAAATAPRRSQRAA